ncbi:hypothetical protein [Aliivibrio fischeri]|uniref:hypothetical protein n=1 Tax=Aliivibrio fischeri TaxID=668 RepID=UPI001F168C57|nr:hypothetical protein [Aliivibrio fischeri]
MSEELRDNFYALNSLYEVLSRVDSALELNEKEIPIYKSIISDRCGNDKVDIQLGENAEYGLLHMPFPKFSTKRYENYLKEIALLDVELYQKITELYKALRYCEKIRSEVGEYLEQEEDYGFWSFSVRIKNMFDKKDEYNSSMQQLHILLTGKGMEIKRSEVIEIKI